MTNPTRVPFGVEPDATRREWRGATRGAGPGPRRYPIR
jgi:hypothetical protein